MKTDFPTVEIYFTFAFTNCKLRIYERDEAFARDILKELRVEFLEEPQDKCMEVDTRLLLGLVKDALPQIFLRKATAALGKVTI